MNPNCKFPLRGNCELAGCMRYRIGKVNCEENIKPIVFEPDPIAEKVSEMQKEISKIKTETKEWKPKIMPSYRDDSLWVCEGIRAFFNLKS